MEVKRLQAVTTAARTALWKARAPRAVAAVARAKRQHQAVARAVNAANRGKEIREENKVTRQKKPTGLAGGSSLTGVTLIVPANALMAYDGLTERILLATRKRVKIHR